MRAIVLPEPWKAVTAEREIPVPKQGEALLKMVCGGICGSDLASYRGQSAYVSYPRTIGHEFAAEVVEVGENPYGIKKGMLVTGNPYFNCGTCYSCRRGYVNACIHNETMGVQREGAFSDYFTMPVERLFDGAGIDPKELALVEPFCISYHGVSRAELKPGDKVLIFGAGAIGILAGVAAKSFGAKAYITDIAEEKVKKAVNDFGLDGGFVNDSPEKLTEFIGTVTGGDGFDATVEAVGAPATFLACVKGSCQPRKDGCDRCREEKCGFQFPGSSEKRIEYVWIQRCNLRRFPGSIKTCPRRICGSYKTDFQNIFRRSCGRSI